MTAACLSTLKERLPFSFQFTPDIVEIMINLHYPPGYRRMLRAGRDSGDDLIPVPAFTDGEIESRKGKRSKSKLFKGRAYAQCLAHTASHKDGFYLKGHLAS